MYMYMYITMYDVTSITGWERYSTDQLSYNKYM